MTDFKIHFFKENQRTDISQELISLFSDKDIFKDGIFKVEQQKGQIVFHYIDKYLPYKAKFSVSEVGIVRAENLLKINPKFLDVNFRLELPFSTPNYFARKLFKMVGMICHRLRLSIFTEFHNDVLDFEQTNIESLYLQLKANYSKSRSAEFVDYIFLDKNKLDQILLYIEQIDKLKEFYKDKDVVISSYTFGKDFEDNFCISTFIEEDKAVVIPPFVDFIIYNKNFNEKVFFANEFFHQLDSILEQVPGISKDCKILKKEKLRKSHKIIHKTNFTKVDKTFQEIDLEKITDK